MPKTPQTIKAGASGADAAAEGVRPSNAETLNSGSPRMSLRMLSRLPKIPVEFRTIQTRMLATTSTIPSDTATRTATAEAIVDILKDDRKREAFGRRGMAWASRFDWDKVADRFEAKMLEVAGVKAEGIAVS